MVKDKDKIRFFGQQRHSIIFKKYLQKKEFILYSESIRYVSIANRKKFPCFLNSPAPAELVHYVMTQTVLEPSEIQETGKPKYVQYNNKKPTFPMNTIEIAIRDCKNDNPHSFGPLYDHFIGKIYKFVFHKVSDDATTEDIVSDVFFKALKSVKNFSGTTEQEFSSWLYRIAYNSVIDFYRTKKEYTELESIEETIGQSPDYSNQLDDNKTLDEILCYLETISKDQKDILIMRIWDDLSYKEIAEITGKSVDACKKTVSRLMAQIEANVTFLFFLVSILYK